MAMMSRRVEPMKNNGTSVNNPDSGWTDHMGRMAFLHYPMRSRTSARYASIPALPAWQRTRASLRIPCRRSAHSVPVVCAFCAGGLRVPCRHCLSSAHGNGSSVMSVCRLGANLVALSVKVVHCSLARSLACSLTRALPIAGETRHGLSFAIKRSPIAKPPL